jgi:hypothetical protein
MENGGIGRDKGIEIISATTSGGRSGHMRMLAAALAASAAAGMGTVREHDPEPRMRVSGGWQYGQMRTSGQGVPGASKARKLRKIKKKMRQQSRKK